MTVGLKRNTVELFEHEVEWEKIAEATIFKLKEILKDDVIAIEHVGSTAIKAIKAKPIIDIAVGVNDLTDILEYNEQLKQANIIYRGSDNENQLLYVMGDFINDTRTHHIHVVKYDSEEWKNYLYFRDYLNQNKEAALEYQQLKEELKNKYGNDRISYTSGKQQWINQILKTRE